MPLHSNQSTRFAELPPLVLVHGWGGTFQSIYGKYGWREAAIASGRSLVEIDLPGHGPNPAPRDPASYFDLAAGLAERLPNNTVDAVGFSLGGKLIIELAIRYQSRFRRIVIGGVGDNIFAPERSSDALAHALEFGVEKTTTEAIATLVAYSHASNCDPLAVAAVLRRPANPVISPERLQQITAALLVINGEEDSIAQPDGKFLAGLPNARRVSLPGIGHLDLPCMPAFQSLTLDFLNQRLSDAAMPASDQTKEGPTL